MARLDFACKNAKQSPALYGFEAKGLFKTIAEAHKRRAAQAEFGIGSHTRALASFSLSHL
jgi:hypothetical protein